MVQRHPKRSDQEWMELIQECRTSGLTDKAWCERNHIQRSSLYYHIRRFRNMAADCLAKRTSVPYSADSAEHNHRTL